MRSFRKEDQDIFKEFVKGLDETEIAVKLQVEEEEVSDARLRIEKALIKTRKSGEIDWYPFWKYLVASRIKTVPISSLRSGDEENVELEIRSVSNVPEKKAEINEADRILRTALQALPVEERTILRLKYGDNTNMEQIAATLSMTKLEVYQRTDEARRRLLTVIKGMMPERRDHADDLKALRKALEAWDEIWKEDPEPEGEEEP